MSQFPSHDQPTVSMLPIPIENTRPAYRDRLSYIAKRKTKTVSSSCVKKREGEGARDLFSHSDSNFAQRSNVHSHPSHCFTGWKSPFCTKRPNLILSFCRRRRVPWPILIREELLSEKPEGAEQLVCSRGLHYARARRIRVTICWWKRNVHSRSSSVPFLRGHLFLYLSELQSCWANETLCNSNARLAPGARIRLSVSNVHRQLVTGLRRWKREVGGSLSTIVVS